MADQAAELKSVATTPQIQYRVEKSRDYPHIFWIELHGDGILHECAVLKRDLNGSVFFFQTNHIYEVDKKRLADLLMNRNARTVELWDLAANKTLGNGVNALVYFHQLAKILNPNGKITDPRSGQVGTFATGTINTNTAM